ncbi:hypothetical protein BHE74_00001535 [Ensete ventricosum]|nr:hypothetical protein BHE74_00001535 [Ensete ventricosum]
MLDSFITDVLWFLKGCVGNDCCLPSLFLAASIFNVSYRLPLLEKVLIRPHPAIWRLVHGMAVVYLAALTFLLFQFIVYEFQLFSYVILQPFIWCLLHALQNRDDARRFMKFLHPDLGVEEEEEKKKKKRRRRRSSSHRPSGDSARGSPASRCCPRCPSAIAACVALAPSPAGESSRRRMRTVRYFDGKTYEWVGISRQPNIIE